MIAKIISEEDSGRIRIADAGTKARSDIPESSNGSFTPETAL